MISKFYLTLAVIATASFSIVSAQQTAKVTASGIGYLEYLPEGYNSNSDNYPLVISLHGIKEKGTSSTDRNRILADLARVDNVGLPKYVKFGQKYPFILISPQLKNNLGAWPPSYVMEVVNHVKKNLRIDKRRIYLTGLSLGGRGVWRTAAEYPDVFAAVASICPAGNALDKANEMAAKNLPAWGFHGSSDKIVSYTVTTKMIHALNSAPKKPNPLAKLTIFQGMGHVIWDKAYNETNVLDWMLSHRKGRSSDDDDDDDEDDDGDDGDDDDGDDDGDDDSSNKAPVVKAGSDRTLVLPANSLYVQGRADDPDGKIASYRWTKISGGNANLGGTTSPRLSASDLEEGTYVFQLTVQDNGGAEKSDEMNVIVEAAKEDDPTDEPDSKNSIPFVSAGPDRVITLPTNSINVQGRASDKDGEIVAYRWSQTYGRSASLSGENSTTVRITNLLAGVYIFRLRAEDNDGGIKDDYFKITVNPESEDGEPSENSNDLPFASAGPDRVITLPTNSINIQGRASDKDGNIVSYQWRKTYGRRATISGARSSKVRISDLEKGIYIFELAVKDNDGGVKRDYFKITVKPSE